MARPWRREKYRTEAVAPRMVRLPPTIRDQRAPNSWPTQPISGEPIGVPPIRTVM
jgi:hypothetical protein